MSNNTYPNNYLYYPDCIFEPERRYVFDRQYVMYRARFNGVYGLYNYLIDDPRVNSVVFSTLHSEANGFNFAGKPYNEALKDLKKDSDPGYKEFLQLQKSLNSGRIGEINKYQTIKTVAGGHLNIPDYCAGNPLCYETQEKIHKPKFIRIHISLSYNCSTNKKQVLNRAIIITNVLKALENAGYTVDLDTFELSEELRELVYIAVKIKNSGQRINMSSLYKALCNVEFLRRLLFRVLETLDVKDHSWGSGYGRTCDKDFIFNALKFNNNDIFFDQPNNMGIRGYRLEDDFSNAIRYLNLSDKIDIDKVNREFNNQVKQLKLDK